MIKKTNYNNKLTHFKLNQKIIINNNMQKRKILKKFIKNYIKIIKIKFKSKIS